MLLVVVAVTVTRAVLEEAAVVVIPLVARELLPQQQPWVLLNQSKRAKPKGIRLSLRIDRPL